MAVLLKDDSGVPIPQALNEAGTAFEALKGVDGAAYLAALRGYNVVATATIASGASLSSAVQNKGYKYFMFQMPAAWTTASLTFQASYDGVTYGDVYMDGYEVVENVAAGRCISLNLNALALASAPYLKLRSGTSASPVNQAAERTIKIVMSY